MSDELKVGDKVYTYRNGPEHVGKIVNIDKNKVVTIKLDKPIEYLYEYINRVEKIK